MELSHLSLEFAVLAEFKRFLHWLFASSSLVFAPQFSSDYIAGYIDSLSSRRTEYTFSMAFSCVQSITLRSRFLHLPPRPHRSRYLKCPCAIPLSPCDRLWAYICVHVEVAAARVAVKS